MPWFDVDEALIAGVLPPQLSQMRKQIRESKRGGSVSNCAPTLRPRKHS